MCIRCRLNQELMAVVGSPEGGTLVFGVRWQWPVLSHDVFILDQSSTYVFYYAPWGCVLIGLGGTRLFCLECPFPSLSVCGLSCCPIMGMGVVLKFCNLQYGCSTVCLAVFSGFVFRIVVISHFVDFTVVWGLYRTWVAVVCRWFVGGCFLLWRWGFLISDASGVLKDDWIVCPCVLACWMFVRLGGRDWPLVIVLFWLVLVD